MRWFLFPSLALMLLGCPGKGDTETGESDNPTDTDVPNPFGGDVGSLAYIRTFENGTLVSAEVLGVFMNVDQGFLNAAQCLRSEDSPCLRELPEPGTRVPYAPEDRFVPTSSQYRYVGLSVEFGPFEAFYSVEEELSRYYADVLEEDDVEGAMGLSLGVEWGPFDADDVVTSPPPLVVTQPIFDPDDSIRIFSDETALQFTWEPASEGEMYLIVRERDPTQPAWVYALEDDGSLEFDVSTLDLVGDHDLAFQLSRWSLTEVDVNDNTLSVQAAAESTYFFRYIDVQNREPVPPLTDTCDETGSPLADGRYYGDLERYEDDYSEAVCVQSFEAAAGRDALAVVEIPPRNELRIDYRQLGSNASIYLYDTCEEALQTCIEGADLDPGNGTESIVRFNPSETETETYHVVLDAVEPFSGGLFFFDLSRTPIPEPDGADSCVDALGLPNLQPGTYYQGDWVGFFDEVNPGVTGCTSTPLTGPDTILPVLVPDNVTLEVTLVSDGGDPALYLLGQCNNPNTCLEGSDQPGNTETLVYTNTTGANQQLSLVVDTSDTNGSPFTLTVRQF